MNHKATCTADRCRDWNSNGRLSVPGTQQPTRVISATRAPEHAEASSRPPGSPAKDESFQAWQRDPLSPIREPSIRPLRYLRAGLPPVPILDLTTETLVTP